MVVQSTNTHAVKKYEEFQTAISLVKKSLDSTDKVLRGMREHPGNSYRGWQIPDKKELLAYRTKADKLLEHLRAESKKYESELMSRGWRV